MKSETDTYEEIRKFVFENNLQDKHSNIYYDGMVNIETENNSDNLMQKISISLGGEFGRMGTVRIHQGERELDSKDFPTEFWTRNIECDYVNNKYLKITGKHPNSNIGNYEVKVYPK